MDPLHARIVAGVRPVLREVASTQLVAADTDEDEPLLSGSRVLVQVPTEVIDDQRGEARHEFTIALTACPVSGEPRPSSESEEVLWLPKGKLAELTMDRSMRLRIDHFLQGGPTRIG